MQEEQKKKGPAAARSLPLDPPRARHKPLHVFYKKRAAALGGRVRTIQQARHRVVVAHAPWLRKSPPFGKNIHIGPAESGTRHEERSPPAPSR